MPESAPSAGAGEDRPAPGTSGLAAAPRAPRLRPTGPVVPADEIAVWGEAREALAAARRHVGETRVWAGETREGERRRGYAEGRAAGDEEAARLMVETAARAAEHLAALERDLPGLVHGIVAQILGDLDARDVIVRAVRRAVEGMRPGTEVTLRVSSVDIAAVDASLSGLAGRAAIRIEPDPALRAGEACLRGALGSVEVGVAAQLRALSTALGVAPAGAAAPSGGMGAA